MDAHWGTLVQRVKMVMPIVDELRSGGMLEWEPYCKIRAAYTHQDKMRELYEVLHSGGNKVKSAFFLQLVKQEPFLLGDLGKFTPILTHIPCELCTVSYTGSIEQTAEALIQSLKG